MPAVVIPEWNAYQVYPEKTVVSYNGALYTCLISNANNTPTSTTYWQGLTVIAPVTPVNRVYAAATITFSDVVSDGETVTIGADVYEFDTNSTITAGHIAVDVSGGATATDAAAALETAVNASTTEPVAAVDNNDDTVTVTATELLAASIATTTDCADGAWDEVELTGEVTGTPGDAGLMYFDSSYIYVCVSTGVWKKASLGSL